MIQMEFLKSGFARLREFSVFLLLGTAVALLWANVNPHAYHAFVEAPLNTWWQGGLKAATGWMAAHEGGGAADVVNFHFVVNDLFMVLFFGMASKEVSESVLPGGALSSFNKAAMPALATAGGVLGPIVVFFIYYFVVIHNPQHVSDLANAAWAVPTATDIAYCWLFAGLIFGRAHPAVNFLLVLAVLDDLIGMIIIAIYYTPHVHLAWLGLVLLGLVICEVMRRMGVKSFWPYVLIGGPLCWFGLHWTGVHAALALVPIMPFMPHAERDSGIFSDNEDRHDTLNEFEHFFSPIVDVGLFTFGLVNAGVALNAQSFGGAVTWMIFLALLIGKTCGIFTFTLIGKKLGLKLPDPITMPQVVVMGCAAGIGFTVALFVTTTALNLAPMQGWTHLPAHVGDMLKLGALLSFGAGPIAWVLAKFTGVQRITGKEPAEAGH